MLNNIKCLYLHCVFHGIRFKVLAMKIGCRDDNLFFFIDFTDHHLSTFPLLIPK